jgi:hypothetical protein
MGAGGSSGETSESSAVDLSTKMSIMNQALYHIPP